MNRTPVRSLSVLCAVTLVFAVSVSASSCRKARRDPTPGTAPESLPPASPPSDTDPSSPPPIAPPTDTRPEVPADVPTHENAPGDGVPPPTTEDESGGEATSDVEVNGDFVPPSWGPPLSEKQMRALDSYAGFSEDGLVYVYVEEQDGVPTMHYVAVPTRTVEKVTPLFTPQVRNQVATELANEGFPSPTSAPAIPPGLEVVVRGKEIHVLFAGMPASRPFRVFEDRRVTIESATPVALSPDEAVVAIRVQAADSSVEPEHRLVRLFE